MRFLFPLTVSAEDVPRIPGLTYRPDFLTADDEATLMTRIDAESWDTSWDRRRQLYGQTYGKRDEPVRPIPAWAKSLVETLHADQVFERPFDQMLVNEYLPGQGIAFHRDYEPFDRVVVSISLLSPCVMDFRRVADGQRESLLLEPRSLLVLQDEARYDWEHGIARRKNDRWHGQAIPRARRLSVTFRASKEPSSR